MFNKEQMAYGAILVGVLIALTQALGWPSNLNYLWAVLVLAWGLMKLN
tara:strand:+ start:635 stop:778 length:144 start_codon:yes stop_codon:yes gene_type:complete